MRLEGMGPREQGWKGACNMDGGQRAYNRRWGGGLGAHGSLRAQATRQAMGRRCGGSYHFFVNTLQRSRLTQSKRPTLSVVYEALPELAHHFSSLIYNLYALTHAHTQTHTRTLILP